MSTVQISSDFVLAAIDMEMTKALNATRELVRLDSIGYSNSQTGLDVAREGKSHLVKVYELYALINDPEVKAVQSEIAEAIGKQEIIIRRIELSL